MIYLPVLGLFVAGLLALGPAIGPGHAQHAHQGGQAQKIGPYEVEIVVKGADVTAFILDEKDNKVSSSDFSATAVVLAKGNEQKTLELKPAGDNKLSGKVDFPIDGKFRTTLTLKSPKGEVGKGRYNLDMTR